MVALGRPGVGESILSETGFIEIERFDVPFAWEFADPETYARALASTGPAYEAIQNVGEKAFLENAIELRARRDAGRAYLASADQPRGIHGLQAPAIEEITMSTIGFLGLPSITSEAQALFDEDVAEDGYVMNVTRLWSHNAPLVTNLFELMSQALADQHLSFRRARHSRCRLRFDAR